MNEKAQITYPRESPYYDPIPKMLLIGDPLRELHKCPISSCKTLNPVAPNSATLMHFKRSFPNVIQKTSQCVASP
jgi:hypothetical protein